MACMHTHTQIVAVSLWVLPGFFSHGPTTATLTVGKTHTCFWKGADADICKVVWAAHWKPAHLLPLMPDQDKPTITRTTADPTRDRAANRQWERWFGSQSNSPIGSATKTNSQLEQIEAMQNKQLLPFWTVSRMKHPERYQWTERLSTTSVKCNSMKAAGTLWGVWTKNLPPAKWPQKSHILQKNYHFQGL